jgi:hypothetical protein
MGKVTLSFKIMPSGKLDDLKIVSNTLKNDKLEKIIFKEFSKCRFKAVDADTKPVLMTYPLLFFPR